MVKDNSGGVVTRGFGKFSRIITRGFARFFKTQSFKPKKKKEPIYKEFIFEIYSPIRKEIKIESNIKLNIIKDLIIKLLLKSSIIKNNILEKDL